MTDRIEDLWRSKQKLDSEAFQEGYAFGEEWAHSKAESMTLEQLEDLHREWISRSSTGSKRFPKKESDSAYTVAEQLVFAIYPALHGSKFDAELFWHTVLSEIINDSRSDAAEICLSPSYPIDDQPPEFIRGFVEGALGI